ncbi:30S ribosomal protein S20 [Patescibacteria group bacterium]|nr:30S ribosomal protein S20 [Patescibacteria group bacterium]
MPITKSAKKALRQSLRKKEINLSRKKKMRSSLNTFKKLIESGKIEEAGKSLPEVYKTLDKMSKVNFIKKGKANRLKSRLSKRLNSSQNKTK